MKNPWYILDIIVIIICAILVLLDLLLTDSKDLKGFLRLRGIFRLFRVFILFRKLHTVRIKSELRKKTHVTENLDLRAPLEIVLDMLYEFRDLVDPSERKIIGNLNYCIKTI